MALLIAMVGLQARWLVAEYASNMPVVPVLLGPEGIAKQIFLGVRRDHTQAEYLSAFFVMAKAQGL
ncbi:hypothetical protein [Ferrimonas pelagia]|uniref:LysR family transcriptional regulator n=1 Tax=Ferrimonas pelagia TaxID=1177826 RepID=A0ABP9E777_9GAMM